ncbi:ankyrin repeat-containing domain protein, partial [Jimgerdemannia flammicorona]
MKLPHKTAIRSEWPSGGLYETTSRNGGFLYRACVAGDIGKVKRLASPRNVNSKFDAGFSPLHFAARHGSVETIELFCRLGALVDAQNDCGETPLYYANRSDVVKCLIKFGADIAIELGNINSARSLARYHQNEIDVFYHRAIQCKQTHIAKLLSDVYDANVNSINNMYQQTPLHTVLSTPFKPEIDIIEDLVTEHKIDVNITDGAGNTPLHICAMYDHINMVRLLAGANPHIHNNEGLMPLHIAAGRSLTEMAIQLVRTCGAEVNAATAETGITAFEVAIICGSTVPFLATLVELGATIEPNLLHVA